MLTGRLIKSSNYEQYDLLNRRLVSLSPNINSIVYFLPRDSRQSGLLTDCLVEPLTYLTNDLSNCRLVSYHIDLLNYRPVSRLTYQLLTQ